MTTTSNARTYFISFLLCTLTAFGNVEAQQAPTTDAVAPNIPGVVAGGTKVQLIKDGFQFTEGPVALSDGSLVFTETSANRLIKIDNDDRTSTFMENTNLSNALALDSNGRLISVQTAPGKFQIGVIYPKGSETVLADGYEGKPLDRPNDLVVDKSGGVYFTDPGPVVQPGAEAPSLPMPPAVYYVPSGGKIIKVADGIAFPNGIQMSPDEKVLYVNDFRGEYLLAFDIQAGGALGNRRNFGKYEGVTKTAERIDSGADGLAVDSDGRVYSATLAGIEIFSSKGEHLGTIPMPRKAQNLAFAGPDKKTLYVVGRGAAFKIQMQTAGFKGRPK